MSLSPSVLCLHFRFSFRVASLSPRSFLPHIFHHRHHLALWFLFFILVASCNYALVFIKLRNQGLTVSFLFLFVLLPSSFPCVLVFVPMCNLIPLQCALIFIFITFNLCWVFISISIAFKWEFSGLCLDYIIYAQWFLFYCLWFCVCTLLFVFYKLLCNCFLHFSCTLLKCSILCNLLFAFCALLKHFLL